MRTQYITIITYILQTMLDSIHKWCMKWRVLINTDKSKCVHFRKPRVQQTDWTFKIGDNVLELVPHYKYLGVTFHFSCDFTMNAEILSKSAGRALGQIISKMQLLKDFGIKTYEKLYNACVIPILEYGAGVWGFRKYHSTDNIQNRAVRYFLGVHRFAPVLAINGELGWLPLQYRRWITMVRYWNRLMKMSNDRLTRQAFEMDYALCKNNWCDSVKNVLTTLGLSSHYEHKTCVNLTTMNTCIYDYYNAHWQTEILKVSKLRYYRSFKNEFCQEQYTVLNLKRNERSLLSQLRCGILPIRIETGRYTGENPEQRVCLFCDSGEVESEIHFLLKCEFYKAIRNEHFGSLFSGALCNIDVDSRKYLMSNHPRKLAKYLVNSYQKRQNLIYRKT